MPFRGPPMPDHIFLAGARHAVLTIAPCERIFPREAVAMNVEHLFLFFIACGAATFPLTLIALRYIASLSPAGRVAHKLDSTFEKALSVSIMVWIVGALIFYVVALYVERKKPCTEQHTNQLTDACRWEFVVNSPKNIAP